MSWNRYNKDVCGEKHRYATGSAARKSLNNIRKFGRRGAGSRGNAEKPQRAYHCDACDGWHLASNDYTSRLSKGREIA